MTGFSKLNPAVVTIWFLAVSGIAMFCNYPLICAVTLIGGILLFVVRNKTAHLTSHLFFFSLCAVLALANPLIAHNGKTVLLVMNNNPHTIR